MLACIDAATGKWLGYYLVGRVRDAYRAEDVVRFLGLIVESHGLPRLGFRLEKGAWAARSVRGIKGADDDEERQIIGSVSDAVDIHYVYESKSKGVIEGSFDPLQSILALIGGPQIGRTRGEYEKSTQAIQRCQNNKDPIHPQEFGFLHESDIADKIDEAMEIADGREKQGRNLQGIPAEKFPIHIASAPLARLDEDKRHLFLPIKQVRPIDAGHVRINVPHYSHTFSFLVPEEYADLGRRYRLLVCFDPADPHAGARVFDAESDRKRDYDMPEGQSYGVFPYAPNAPQLDFSKTARSGAKKKYLAAARTVFRATGMQTGTGASVDQVADGEGNSTTIARGIQRAEQAVKARSTHVSRGTAEATDRANAKRLLTQPHNTRHHEHNAEIEH